MSKRKLWHLGNTTVRSPFRLREGLIALSASDLQGNLRGRVQEIKFRKLLGEHAIVKLGDDKTYSVGRKWRSALQKLGFLYPDLPRSTKISQEEVGPVDSITPNGQRLIQSEAVPAIQECFLRALAAHYITTFLEKDYHFKVFSPLRHTLAIMIELEKITGESLLTFSEMSVIVQCTSSEDKLEEIVKRIKVLRERRSRSSNKRKFDQAEREKASKIYGYVSQTFNDYADTNFRYLKATGLVQSKGRGLCLIPEKRVFIEKLVQDRALPKSDLTYIMNLCDGAKLPTDNKDHALEVLGDLIGRIKEKGLPYDATGKKLDTPANIAIVRHQLEEQLLKDNEEKYGNEQVEHWEEISLYLELIENPRQSRVLPNGEEIRLPSAELAAYFEWILWRAFLAIDSLTNKPYEARRFKIDQDFQPIGPAPGNGPDMIFEFNDCVIVVEVTLTDNSRQEAVEGEPVRRHVADIMLEHNKTSKKPVYGLFIAKRINANTAETFRRGIWFDKTEKKMHLNILPITLDQFKNIFKYLLKDCPINVGLIREIIDQCIGFRKDFDEGPKWQKRISLELNRIINQPL